MKGAIKSSWPSHICSYKVNAALSPQMCLIARISTHQSPKIYVKNHYNNVILIVLNNICLSLGFTSFLLTTFLSIMTFLTTHKTIKFSFLSQILMWFKSLIMVSFLVMFLLILKTMRIWSFLVCLILEFLSLCCSWILSLTTKSSIFISYFLCLRDVPKLF